MSTFFSKRKKRILPAILVALALPVVVFLEAPVEVYASNMDELAFSLRDFLPFCLALWLVGAFLTAVVLYLLPEKLYRIACSGAAAVGLLLFLQGTYLNFGINSLPGDDLAGGYSSAATVIDTVVWVLVLGGAVILPFVNKGGIDRLVCIFVAALVLGTQAVNLAFVLLTTENVTLTKLEIMQLEDPDYEPKVLAADRMTTLTDQHNIVIFLLDRFDEKYAERAYEQTPEVYDELEGFTWFQDCISMFGHTYPAVPWMLTETPYSTDMDRVSYLDSAYEGETPLKMLSEEGYAIDLYVQRFYAYTEAANLPDYITNLVPESQSGYVSVRRLCLTTGKLVEASLYRCMPIAMKDILSDVDSQLDKFYKKEQTVRSVTTDMKNVYNQLAGSDFQLEEGNSFRFIHVDGCHNVRYDENWKKAEGDAAKDKVVSVRVSFKLVDRYLQEMKRLGVYDDATIIITGDHAAAIDDTAPLGGTRLTALFVKPSGSASEPLKISQAQVSHEDLWATIFHSEGLACDAGQGTDVFEMDEGQTRTRTYCWHAYVREPERMLDEYDYEIVGPGSEFSNWKIVGHEHYDGRILTD